MPELKNWYIVKLGSSKYLAKGTVYGHPKQYKCPDGLFIHTSEIQDIVDNSDIITVHTLNNEYILKKAEINFTSREYDNKILEECLNNYLNNGADFYRQLQEIISQKEKVKCKNAEMLNPEQIYIDFSDTSEYYFNYAVFKNQTGKVIDCNHFVHVGMIQDSVLISTDDVDMKASYFPYKKNNIEFYSSFYENKDSYGYVHNSGATPLLITFPWNTIQLSPGDTAQISENYLSSLPKAARTSSDDLYPAQELGSSVKIIFPDNEKTNMEEHNG